MDRDAFVDFLAHIAAGEAAKPETVEAFHRYYNANTPRRPIRDLIAIDEILISGTARASMVATLDVYDLSQRIFMSGVNLFGGILLYRMAPDGKKITSESEVAWRIVGVDSAADFTGHISYLDQNAVRHTKQMTTIEGTLV